MRFVKVILSILILSNFIFGCSAKKDQPRPNIEKQKAEASLDLFEAILKSDVLAVKKAIGEGADVNMYDFEGYTPIIKALQMGNPIIVRDLLDSGAKIFKPKANDINVDIFLSYDENSDNEVALLINNEVKRIGLESEKIIHLKEFDRSLNYFQDNFIPPTILMPGRLESAVLMASKYTDINTDLTFLKYLIFHPKNTGSELENISEELLRITSEVKSIEFLGSLVTEYKLKEADHRFSTINELDYEVVWFKEKLELLRLENIYVVKSEVEAPFKSSKFELRSDLESKSVYEDLLAEVLMTRIVNVSHYDRNSLVQIAIVDLSYRSYTDINFLTWVTGAIDVWKRHRPALPSTGYQFDKNAIIILQALELNTNYDLDTVKATFDSLALFADVQENKSEESFKLILGSDNFQDHHKKELLKLILEKTHVLPQNIMAIAIENGGYRTLRVLLDSGFNIDPENQKSSVLAAVINSTSAGDAVTILNLLKDYGVDFNSDFGADAMLVAFNKAWNGNQIDYLNVTSFLMNTSPSIFENIKSERVQNLVKEILNAVRDRKQDWSILKTIFNNIPEAVVYERELIINESTLKVKMSLLWDLILTMYHVYDFNYEELVPIINLLDSVLSKFNLETNAMAVLVDGNQLDSIKNLIHGMLPVSLLLSAGKDEIEKALLKIDDRPLTLNEPNQRISFQVFMDSDFFKKYSEERDYWKEVSKVLIKNSSSQLELSNDWSSLNFYKILVESGLLRSFQGLANIIDIRNIELIDSEISCSFLQHDNSNPNNFGIGFDNASRSDFHLTSEQWTTLGSFEALITYKDRACSGDEITETEISFISEYINANYTNQINRTSLNSFSGNLKDCSSLYLDQSNSLQRVYYTELGVLTDNEDQDGVTSTFRNIRFGGFDQKCMVYPHSPRLHLEAKKEFLESWFYCAKNLNQTRSVNLFERLKGNFDLEPIEHERSDIKICRM